MGQYENHIDVAKTEQELIPKLKEITFKRLVLNNSLLVIDDTLLLFDDDTTTHAFGFLRDTLRMDQWTNEKQISEELMVAIKMLLNETSNYRAINENDAYFFSEGGWIDSNWGKAYSVDDISDKEESFKFDRVQDIDPIRGKPNWYEYYAD